MSLRRAQKADIFLVRVLIFLHIIEQPTQEDAGQGNGQTFVESRKEKNLSQKKVQKSLSEKISEGERYS